MLAQTLLYLSIASCAGHTEVHTTQSATGAPWLALRWGAWLAPGSYLLEYMLVGHTVQYNPPDLVGSDTSRPSLYRRGEPHRMPDCERAIGTGNFFTQKA